MDALWRWLTTPPTYEGALDAFGAAYLLVFAAGFVVSAYVSGPDANRFTGNSIRPEDARHWAMVGLGVFGIGLFFFAVRALQIDPLSFGEPIWMVGCVIALVVALVRFTIWLRHARNTTARNEFPPSPGSTGEGVGG